MFLDFLSSNISRNPFDRRTYAPSMVTTCPGWTASPMTRHYFKVPTAWHSSSHPVIESHRFQIHFKKVLAHWVYVGLVDISLVHVSMPSPTVYPLHWIHRSKEKSDK